MIQSILPDDIILCDYEEYLKKCEQSTENPFKNPLMYFF